MLSQTRAGFKQKMRFTAPIARIGRGVRLWRSAHRSAEDTFEALEIDFDEKESA
jgi:hypothetical protein